MQKRIGLINDISCEGRCSITAALPIISAAGMHVNLKPTALLSTQTGGYTDYTYMDLSKDMLEIAKHFKSLELNFDIIYSGYLSGVKQIDIVMEIAELLKPSMLIVDPVMGDGGQLYSGFTARYCEKMKELCAVADVITPNITEACLLTGRKYGRMEKGDIEAIMTDLKLLGPKHTVITGIKMDDEASMCIAAYDGNYKGMNFHPELNGIYHGAGDVFGAALTCGLASGNSLKDAVKTAGDFTYKCIVQTKEDKTDTRQGLNFEKCLRDIFEAFNR